jgi:MOSC domain-containing protein YiiM
MYVVFSVYLAPAAGAATKSVAEVCVNGGRGLAGDRYHAGVGSFSRWPDSGRAVTLIEQEAIDEILRETGIDLNAGQHRRNIVTGGIRLADLNGKKFQIGTAILRGARLAAPCRYLERLVGPGVFAAMKGRGGLRADVVQEGVIHTGDAIETRVVL